jgi:hypothetical protein
MKRDTPAHIAADEIELITKDNVCQRLKLSLWTLQRMIKREGSSCSTVAAVAGHRSTQ